MIAPPKTKEVLGWFWDSFLKSIGVRPKGQWD